MKAKLVIENIEDTFKSKDENDIVQTKIKTIKKFMAIASGSQEPPGAGTYNYEGDEGEYIEDEEIKKYIDIVMYFYDINWEELEEPYISRILSQWEHGNTSPKDAVEEIQDELIGTLEELDDINERGGGGAGYATWGGGWGRSFGNPSQGRSFGGRGFGFGQSSSSGGGPNVMYTYSIKPLNQILEPDPTYADVVDKIYPGVIIKAKLFNEDKYIIGQVQSIEEDGDGNISSYTIMDPDKAQPVKVDPTSAFVWKPQPEGIDQDWVVNDLPGLKNESLRAKFIKPRK